MKGKQPIESNSKSSFQFQIQHILILRSYHHKDLHIIERKVQVLNTNNVLASSTHPFLSNQSREATRFSAQESKLEKHSPQYKMTIQSQLKVLKSSPKAVEPRHLPGLRHVHHLVLMSISSPALSCGKRREKRCHFECFAGYDSNERKEK